MSQLGSRQLRRLSGRDTKTVCEFRAAGYTYGGMAVDPIDGQIYLMHGGVDAGYSSTSSVIYRVKADGGLEKLNLQDGGSDISQSYYLRYENIKAFNGKIYIAAHGGSPDSPGSILVFQTNGGTGGVVRLAGLQSGVQADVTGSGGAARFGHIYDFTVLHDGSVYVLDYLNSQSIKRISPSGFVTRIVNTAGTSAPAYRSGICGDRAGNIYYCTTNQKIAKLEPSGRITIIAGSGTAGTADGQGVLAQFSRGFGSATYAYPGMVMDPGAQFMYVSDFGGIRRVDTDGTVTTVASRPFLSRTETGTDMLAAFSEQYPAAFNVQVDNAGNLYVVYQDAQSLTLLSFDTAIALKSNGGVWTWGINISGNLGDSSTQHRSSPVSVIGSHSFVSISSNYRTNWGLKSDGSAWGWGDGGLGRLGTNETVNRSSPVSAVGGHSFVEIVGYYQHARKADGYVWAWGKGSNGSNGDNTAANRSSPVSVVGNHSFSALGGYWHALKTGGVAWAWGYNGFGNLGDNTTNNRSSPVLVVGGHVFVKVRSSFFNAAGIKADGSVWTWGKNNYGALGLNNTANRSSPVSVVGGHSFVDILTGYNYIGGLKSDGALWMWGYNGYGQLADGTNFHRSSPVSVIGNHSFARVGTHGSGRIVQKADGSLWSWGFNGVGNVGDNTTQSRSSPVMVVPF